ncbi:hypothetical protein EC973_002946 [Apophysomyces ossiformis]|uniref:Uncharacterized protein n=1 Tax=Apophysomyces ossiformis TaxID=679940 RepID=A0A8H7EQU2_9FUNG|nr:hypothetical protein EC973_002946 [Apophysomyces ossiformis]
MSSYKKPTNKEILARAELANKMRQILEDQKRAAHSVLDDIEFEYPDERDWVDMDNSMLPNLPDETPRPDSHLSPDEEDDGLPPYRQLPDGTAELIG